MSVVTRRFTAFRERPMRLLFAVVAIAFAGATAFGLWHLVVGGLINGNPRAGTFGLLLALGAGSPLVIGAWLRARSGRRAA
jgi:hypothetical protein